MSLLLGIMAAATVVIVPVGSRVPRSPEAAASRAGSRDRGSVRRHRLADRLDRADIDLDVARVPSLWLTLALVGGVVGFAVAGLAGVFGALVTVALGPPAWVALRGDRRRARVLESLPELLELVARSLRGGADLRSSLRDAAAAVPAVGRPLERALARADAGARLGEALDRWALELDHPDAAIVRSVLRLGDATGAALATALDRAAATLRERAALRDEISALTAQTRASSMVVALAPVGFLLVVTTTDPRSAEVLFTSMWGRLCLAVGLGLDAVGIAWMRRLTGQVER